MEYRNLWMSTHPTWNDLVEDAQRQGRFTVEPVKVRGMQTDYRAIITEGGGVAIVGRKYHPLPHDVVLAAGEKFLQSGWKYAGGMLLKNGLVLTAAFQPTPDIVPAINEDGEIVPTAFVVNSLDGTFRFSTAIYPFRVFCFNVLVGVLDALSDNRMGFFRKHTKGIQLLNGSGIDAVVNGVQEAFREYMDVRESLKRPIDFSKVLNELFPPVEGEGKGAARKRVWREKQVQALKQAYFNDDLRDEPHNLWRLVNAAVAVDQHFSLRGDKSVDGVALRILQRQPGPMTKRVMAYIGLN